MSTSATRAGTYFNYTVLFDRSDPTFSPETIIKMNTETAKARSEIADLIGTSASFTSYMIELDEVPQWSIAPSSTDVTNSTANFTATVSSDGIVCMVCSDYKDMSTAAWQAQAGLNSKNELSEFGYCQDAYESSQLDFYVDGLDDGTGYYCYFTACSTYPLWPSCIEGDEFSGIAHVYIKTMNTTTESSIFLTIGVLIIMIFN